MVTPTKFEIEALFIDGDLEVLAYQTYKKIFTKIEGANLHLLRIWNTLTDINHGADESGKGDYERYKLFNRGRRKAWLEYDPSLKTICAATCVGSFGQNILKISALATPYQVIHLENPNQISFLDYSAKYGTPPSSRRGTLHITPSGVEIWISGTASITGEDNRFAGDHEPKDLTKQIKQTLKNIEILISDTNISSYYPDWQPNNLQLADLRKVKVYLRNMSDQSVTEELIKSNGIALENVELVHADLCRKPLDIEIEAMIPAIPDTKQVLTSLTA